MCFLQQHVPVSHQCAHEHARFCWVDDGGQWRIPSRSFSFVICETEASTPCLFLTIRAAGNGHVNGLKTSLLI